MSAAEKKFLIIFASVLAIWRIMQLPRVQDALLQFLTVGAIPGTSRTLSPDAMQLLMAGFFSVSLVLIFRKELVDSLRGSRRAVKPRLPTQVRSKQVSVKPQRTEPRFLAVGRLSASTGRVARRTAATVRHTIISAATIGFYLLRKGIKHAVVLTVRFWHWLEPHIRQFDHWLDVELHNNRRTAHLLEVGEDFWKTLTGWRHRV